MPLPPILTDDALRDEPSEHVDVVITNPPFGKKSSVTIVNDAPVISFSDTSTTTVLDVPPNLTVTTDEDIDFTFSVANGALLSVSDVDVDETSPNSDPLLSNTVQVTLTVNHGELSLAPGAIGALNFVAGSGFGDGTADRSMRFIGTISQVNAALVNLLYDPEIGRAHV